MLTVTIKIQSSRPQFCWLVGLSCVLFQDVCTGFHDVVRLLRFVSDAILSSRLRLQTPTVQSVGKKRGTPRIRQSQDHIDLRMRILEDSKIKVLSVEGEFKEPQESREDVYMHRILLMIGFLGPDPNIITQHEIV